MTKITLTQEDITQVAVDAIVNSANITLLSGGGVDGKINRAAGEKLKEECRTLGGCKAGEAKITKAYKLPAKHIFHAVGPVWKGDNRNEAELLHCAYINSLHVAMENKIKTIAFPNISTNTYMYPKHAAAVIAIGAVYDFFIENPSIFDEILFVCYYYENYGIYKDLQEWSI